MLSCVGEASGFAVYQCLSCRVGQHKVNFSYKSKACPQCGKRYSRESMEKSAAQLLRVVSYRQVVLIRPSELRKPFYNHPQQGALYSRFIRSGRTCLEELIGQQLHCNTLKVATIVFIHTHGRNGRYNPHIHIILVEDGFNPETEQ